MQSLNVAFGAAGLAPAAVAAGTLTRLELGAVDDDDIAALGGATSLIELRFGGCTDGQLVRLSRAPLALEVVHVSGREITATGIAALLGAPWPLRELAVANASIGDASALPPVPDRALELRLYKCAVPRRELERLQRSWGDSLVVVA